MSTLDDLLQKLKTNGVTRAKFDGAGGLLEVEFAPYYPDVAPDKPNEHASQLKRSAKILQMGKPADD